MNKLLCIGYLLILLGFSRFALGQLKKENSNHFNEISAREQAASKGLTYGEADGYIQFLKNDFSSKKALEQQAHKHSPYETAHNNDVSETTIYLEPNKPMSLSCPNMGFEQYNFNGWTGSTGTVSIGSTFPIYNQTSGVIVNPAGDNASLINTANYHTIMTIPASNPVYPNCVGYDSIACKVAGTQTVSQISHVSPFSFDKISVRMNGAIANKRACKLKYITTSSVNNKRLSYSYALVFHDPTNTIPAHTEGESPYFKVTIKNEITGLELPSCSSYSFNPITAQASDSLESSVTSTGDPVKYRKWVYNTVDLSSLPAGTPVSINFEVGGCTTGGHYSYAYVDAECGGYATAYSNMCSGTNFATLVAPTGFTAYQWYNSAGVPILGATNDTLVQTTTPGSTFSIDMTTQGGCVITQTVTVALTTVNLINLNATSSCAGGNSGSATVLANGSNGAYTYTWTNTSTSTIVSTNQTATNLEPGNYSILVSSAGCGQASANFAIGFSPPYFYSQIKSFCGNATFLENTGGTNYLWYQNMVPILGPAGSNDTLYINDAVDKDIYTLVYKNPQGCRDSISYILNQLQGGSVDFYALSNSCLEDSSGSAGLNFTSSNPPPYQYFVTGPSSSSVQYNNSGSITSFNLTNLPVGTYTAVVNDGLCYYHKTININPVLTNYTLTPDTYTLICFPDEVTVDLEIGEEIPTTCALSNIPCNSIPKVLFSSPPFTQNAANEYPTPFGNLFTNGRSQFLIRKTDLNSAGITAGKLNSLALNVLDLNAGAKKYPNFSINIGCSNLTALPNASSVSQPFIAGLLPVYSHSNQAISLGWQTYEFSQPYMWDGVSNIIVEVCFSFPNLSGTGNSSQNISVELKQMPYIANMYHVENTNSVCGGAQQANNGIGSSMLNGMNMLPNMKFGFCNVPDPSTYTVTISSNGLITANYSNDSITIAPNFSMPAGTVIYTVSVQNPDGGCIKNKTITAFYPPINTTITATPTNTTICESDSISFSAVGAIDFNWYHNVVGTSISTSSIITVVPPNTGLNNYIVTGVYPCPNSVLDTKTVTVNVIPTADLAITTIPDITKCLNQDFILNANVTSMTSGNPATPFVYSWTTLPGNNPAPGIDSLINYTVTSNSTNTFVVTVNGYCSNSTSDTVIVKNYANDIGISVSNSITVCANTPFTLNSITTGGQPNFNYSWTLNSSTVAITPTLNITSPTIGGTYTLEVTVTDSCNYQKSATQQIYVLPNTLNITITDSAFYCGNTPFTLHSISSGGYPNYTFNWYLSPDNNNSLSSSDSLSYITPATEGIYTFEVVKKDSCGNERSDFQQISVLPPCEITIPNVITPNGDGANEFFKILNSYYHPNIGVTIFDRWGNKIYESSDYQNDWKAEGLDDGTYFYVVDVPQDKKYTGFITVFKNR
jgi:gliding motility-associated-like protein